MNSFADMLDYFVGGGVKYITIEGARVYVSSYRQVELEDVRVQQFCGMNIDNVDEIENYSLFHH